MVELKDLGKWVKDYGLPVLGSAIEGPAGVLVVSALKAAIGAPDATPSEVQKVLQESEKARAEALKFSMENTLALEQMASADRDSARKREIAVKDNTNRVLAYTIVGSFVAVIGGALLGYAKVDSAMTGTLVGYLSAKAEQVIAYYFGSTFGSREKTQLLAQSKPA